ncbi:MAG: decaprenyl-phosphate phosphoribosyltransferase [Planctomycetota bacterium]|jgi:4-hydroxybenzoate polyprenyltransferase
MIAAILQAMRPYQWVKNLLVLAPLIFADKLGDTEAILSAVAAFVVFCLLSSAVYLLNDVVDREADRAHPRKQHRPVAAGTLSVHTALLGAAVLAGGSLAVASTLGPSGRDAPFVMWPACYFVLNVAYSFFLKGLLIIDCLSIAVGFLFRVHAGSVVINVQSSSWIILCTFFFALFLAFCKRRDEVTRVDDGTAVTRASLRHYSQAYLDQVIPPLAALSILCYALYTLAADTVASHGPNLILTVPIVVFGVFRYLFLVHNGGESGDPSRVLFRDRSLIASGVLYLLVLYAVLSMPHLGELK